MRPTLVTLITGFLAAAVLWTPPTTAAEATAQGAIPAAKGADASTDGERLVFRIAYGNVQLAEATVWLNQRDGRYVVSGEGSTSGPLDWLLDWRGRVRTEGRFLDDALLPMVHAQNGMWRGQSRQALVQYRPDRTVLHRVEPPLDPLEFTHVPEDSIPGTVDPLTAALTALKRFAETGHCGGVLPIFDGRRRYDMLLEDAGPAVLARDRPWNYDGRAHGCRLKSRRIGGFHKDPEEDSGSPESERMVWLAELAPRTWRPVRIEIDAPLGKVIGRAVMTAD